MSDQRLGKILLGGLALLTAAIVAAQIALSRLLASTLGYYFAFMLVSFAMLGLASGGLLVHVRVQGFRREKLERDAAVLALLCAACTCAGTIAYLRVYAPSDRSWILVWLTPAFLCLFPLFLFGGIAVSLILRYAGAYFHRAYAVDLAGAAAGAGAAVLMLSTSSPMEVLQGVALLSTAAGALLAYGARLKALVAVAIAIAAGIFGVATWVNRSPARQSPPHVDWVWRSRSYVGWNAFSSITVFPGAFFSWGLSETYRGPTFPMQDLIIDGIGGTQLVGFDGDPRSLRRYEYLDADISALGQALAPAAASQLVIGPGAGVDLLQAVRAGRTDVDAVEINPLMVELVNHRLSDFSGSPYRLPGVHLAVENGRTFIQRSRKRWGLISLTWVDTGGSATALAASENYLYTVEAYEQFLRHLAPDGLLAFMRATGERAPDRPVDTLRAISVTLEALERLGARRPGDHVVVLSVESPFFYRRGMSYVLVKRTPFTPPELARVREFASRLHFQPLWLPGDVSPPQRPRGVRPVAALAHQLLSATDRRGLYRAAAIDVQPTTDDQPFYFVERGGPNRRSSEGLSLLWTCFTFLSVMVASFVGAPLAAMARSGNAPPASALRFLAYCCLLGTGFMLVEMELFHVFALLLGSPLHSLAVVLVGLLVFSGAGSACASWYRRRRPLAFGGLLACLALFVLCRGILLTSRLPLPLGLRIAATLLVIAPLAFHLGLPMALGMAAVAQEPIWMTWGWALNGACSVLASVGAVLLAIHVGITATFLIGLSCYATGWMLLGRVVSVAAPVSLPASAVAAS
ncbi:MAG: hypothetical protein ACXWLR_00420 [Myxococcales bacterium]